MHREKPSCGDLGLRHVLEESEHFDRLLARWLRLELKPDAAPALTGVSFELYWQPMTYSMRTSQLGRLQRQTVLALQET